MLINNSWQGLANKLLAQAYIWRYSWQFTVLKLQEQDADSTAHLLADEFCQREPLCRSLGITLATLQPFFRDQVDYCLRLGLGVIVKDRSGRILAAMTIEDHARPYEPNTKLLTPELAQIGQQLEGVAVPPAFDSREPGQVAYFGLAAIDRRRTHPALLNLLQCAAHLQTRRHGFRLAYAKVSNPGLLRRIRKKRVHLMHDLKIIESQSPKAQGTGLAWMGWRLGEPI